MPVFFLTQLYEILEKLWKEMFSMASSGVVASKRQNTKSNTSLFLKEMSLHPVFIQNLPKMSWTREVDVDVKINLYTHAHVLYVKNVHGHSLVN